MQRAVNNLLIVTALLLAGVQLVLADTAALQTRFVPPHVIADALAPMLADNESVSAAGGQLLIRAPATRIGELRDLAMAMDAPPRRLLPRQL